MYHIKHRVYSFLFLALFLFGAFGCTQLERLHSGSDVVVDVAVRHSVFRFIDHADTAEAKAQRALRVMEVAEKALQLVDVDADVSTDALMAVIEGATRWDRLDEDEEVILRELLRLVESNLRKRQSEGVLSRDAVVSLRGLLTTVINTASLL